MDGTIITKKGIQLLVKLMATEGMLKITRVSVGTGILPNGYDPASLLDIVQYKMDGMIAECKADGDIAQITMQISSVGIETGFTMTEMGVFAEDPDIGEILYAYLDMREDPQYVYAEGGAAQKFIEITLDIAISEATKVTTYINPSSMITRKEFEEERNALLEQIKRLEQVKNNTRVFETTAELNTWLTVPENMKELNIGDNLYIKETDVPDYWWDGTKKRELETKKINLTEYDQQIEELKEKMQSFEETKGDIVGSALGQALTLTAASTWAQIITKIKSVVNRGAWNGSISTSGGSVTVPKGYHSGSGKVTGPTLAALVGTGVTLASAANLLTGVTAYGKDGTKYTGTMPNNGTVAGTISVSGGTYTVPKGYHSGSGKVTGPTLAALVGSNVSLASAANLLTGVTAYGKNGTKYTGTNKGYDAGVAAGKIALKASSVYTKRWQGVEATAAYSHKYTSTADGVYLFIGNIQSRYIEQNPGHSTASSTAVSGGAALIKEWKQNSGTTAPYGITHVAIVKMPSGSACTLAIDLQNSQYTLGCLYILKIADL